MSVAQFGLNLGPQPSTDGAGAVEAARGEGGGGGRRHRRGLERLCALPPGPRPQRTPPPGPRPRAEPSPSPTPPQGEPGPVRTSPLPHLPKPLSSPSLRGWWVTRTGRGSPPRVGTEGGCLVINVRAGGEQRGGGASPVDPEGGGGGAQGRSSRGGGPVSSAPRAAPRPGPPAPATCTPPLRPRPSPGTAEARSARARARARLPSRRAPRSRCSRHAAALSPPADPGSPTSTKDLCWLCEKVAFSRQDDQPCGRAEPGDRLPEPGSSETGKREHLRNVWF